MKSISKKIVAIVVAAAIVMTMSCVMAFSASAALSKFELISGTVTKDVSDMKVTKTGATADYEVVAPSTLTGGTTYAGAATDVYLATVTEGVPKDGFIIENNGGSLDFSSFDANKADCTLDAWIWISDYTKVNNLVVRVYSSDGMQLNSGTGTYVELYPYQTNGSQLGLGTGWTHVSMKMNNANGWQSNPGLTVGYSDTKQITGISFHDHAGAKEGGFSIGVASVKITYGTEDPSSALPPSSDVSSDVSDTSSVVATDSNTVGSTIVSPNLDKALDNIVKGNRADSPNTGVLSVVDSKTLTGGASGVPAEKSYKITGASKLEGMVVPVLDTDWSDAAAANLSGYGVNAWIWVSDSTKIANLVLRFFEDDKRTGIDGWTYQVGSKSSTSTTFSTGWNNVTFWFPASGDFDHRTNVGTTGTTITSMLIEDHEATASYDLALACARLVKSGEETKSWGAGGTQTGDAMNVGIIVIAVLIAAIAASATVYFGKKSAR